MILTSISLCLEKVQDSAVVTVEHYGEFIGAVLNSAIPERWVSLTVILVTNFLIFRYTFGTNKATHLKFGRQIVFSKCYLVDIKLSTKGAWLGLRFLTSLLAFHSNYGRISHHFQGTLTYWLKVTTSTCIWHPIKGDFFGILQWCGFPAEKVSSYV